MYDFFNEFGLFYEWMIDWKTRLAEEIPFIESYLEKYKLRQVLDVNCGIGYHAEKLANDGYKVYGVDSCPELIKIAQQYRVSKNKKQLEFICSDLFRNDIMPKIPLSDMIISFGDSIFQVKNYKELVLAFNNFHKMIKLGGIFLLSLKNYPLLKSKNERFLPPITYQDDEREIIFLTIHDFFDNYLEYNILILTKIKNNWQSKRFSTRLSYISIDDIKKALKKSSFTVLDTYGNIKGDPFDPEKNEEIIIVSSRG